MKGTPKQRIETFCNEHGVELNDETSSAGIDFDLWTPPGKVWATTQTHGLRVWFFSDKAAAWRSLWSDVEPGLVNCTDPECETCNDEEMN